MGTCIGLKVKSNEKAGGGGGGYERLQMLATGLSGRDKDCYFLFFFGRHLLFWNT
jgi:hypothetical protein